MQNFTPKKAAKILKNVDTSPSQEWTNETLSRIKSLEEVQQNSHILFPNLFAMKKLLSGISLVLVVSLAIGGYFYSTNTPYAQALNHLRNATTALEQLKNPNAVVTEQSFIKTAYAESTSAGQKVKLIKTVETETDAAVSSLEGVKDTDDLSELLERLDELQDETVDTLSALIAESDDDTVIEAATVVAENTDAGNEIIEKVLHQKDLKESPKLKEEIAAKRAERKIQRIENIETILRDLKISYEKMDDNMKKKYDAIQEILVNCQSQTDEKCNLGKVKGLSVALTAKARNEVRQEEREEEVNKEVKEEMKEIKEETKEEVKEEKEAIQNQKNDEEEDDEETVEEEDDKDDDSIEKAPKYEKEDKEEDEEETEDD